MKLNREQIATRAKETLRDPKVRYTLLGLFVIIATGFTIKELHDGHLGIRMVFKNAKEKLGKRTKTT